MLKDATQAGFLQMLQSMGVPYELNKAEQVLTLTEPRSKILFRAVEEFDRLRGTNLAWFGVDELTYAPEEAWLRLEARLRDPKAARLCGFAVWTPKGRDWVWRRFIENKTAGYEAIRAKAYENKFLLEKTPDFYERLKASYDEQFFAQEVLGDYVHQTDGLVYFAFDRTLHVQEVKFDPHRPLLWALDFNVNPMSSVIAQRYGDTISVLDEIVLRQATTDQAAEEFLNRYPSHGPGVVIYGDSAGNNQHTTGGTDYDIVRRRLSSAGVSAQYRVPRGNPLIHARTNLVNSMFRNAERGAAGHLRGCTALHLRPRRQPRLGHRRRRPGQLRRYVVHLARHARVRERPRLVAGIPDRRRLHQQRLRLLTARPPSARHPKAPGARNPGARGDQYLVLRTGFSRTRRCWVDPATRAT
jgi:hypothetical protein